MRGRAERHSLPCKLQPVRAAIARGGYGDWRPSRVERERLEEIFPTGVCRY